MATTAEKLKAALDPWSWSGGAANWNKVIEGTYGNILGFKRGQEVVDQMIDYNNKLGNLLTDEQLIAGLNKFSQSQFDQYGSGYAVDSDPFNIGRWSVWNALNDAGMRNAGDQLIWDTDARQALTSQQAIEIGKKAQAEYAAADAQMRELAKVTGYGGGTTLGGYVQPDSGWGWLDDLVMTAAPLIVAGGFGAGLAGFGGLGGAAAGEVLGAGALAETAGAGALGSGLTAGGGLGLTAGGGTGLAGTISGLGSAAAGGGLTAAGLTGTGLGAGWAGLGAGLTGAAEGALGSGLSAGGNAAGGITGSIDGLGSIGSIGGEGLQGIATGALDGTAGALGSTSGAAGLTGTIEGLGTLTAEGMLIPAAGGAAVPLSSLTSGLPSLSDLKSLLDKAKEVKSGVSAVTTALGGGATAPKTTKPATANAGAFSGMYPVSQGKSALEAMMSGEDSSSLDEFMRLMAQSGKGA